MTPAMGGLRDVPVPDAIARDYLLLALRLDQHIPGLVDGYFGPADLKAQVDTASLVPPAKLRDDAAALLVRLPNDVDDDARRDWLLAQVTALERQAADLAGERLPYVDHLRACFGWTPVRRDQALFDDAAAELEALLPGDGSLTDRLAAWDARFTIDPAAVPPAVDWLWAGFRERATSLWGLPDGERLQVRLVRDQPWAGYNWYDGGLRSRVDLNLDLPIRADSLIHVVAHETYLGHHLEHAWREAEQVTRLGRLEASILLINTPECLISEGLADLGVSLAVSRDDHVDLLAELYGRAGLAVAADDAQARDAAQRHVAMASARRRLAESRVNAALLRHADGVSHEEVAAWLVETWRLPADAVEKRLEFIEHPLWKTYVFVYSEGEQLLDRWVHAGGAQAPADRFGRLLREPLTPAAISAELAAAGPA